ncbi:hypothetical protein GO491_05080 [Flavobacteriaceae bacterium Ap0902]|nr:hypothetical protein [Flavobacteriaceae bacterium Ap0902]
MKNWCFIFIVLSSSFAFSQVEDIDNKINLRDMVIDGTRDETARQLIKEVIKKQKQNSPKHLDAYQFQSYTKFLSKIDYNDIPDFKPKTAKDSIKIKNYQESLQFHEGLLEKGMTYAYTKTKGEKIITDAARISGIKTPLLEIATIDPLPYAFDTDEFKFFYFRSFINPISNKGLQHYNYQIQDTIILNDRSTIEVSFKNIRPKDKPLYGTLLIDEADKALAEFYAEYEGNPEDYSNGGITIIVGSKNPKNYFLTSKYKKINGAWFPDRQNYYRVSKVKYHTDSLQLKPKDYYYTNTMSAEVTYFNHQNNVTLDDKAFKGFNHEITKEAFYKFDEIIPDYRTDSLTRLEKETYVVLDSVGEKENVNKIIKYGRFFLNGLNIPMGSLDFYLPSIYGSNGHEGTVLGAKLSTNNNFHDRIGFEGSINYGFKDKKFKYMLGTNYVVNKEKHAIIGARYKSDVTAFGKPVNAVRSGFNYFREKWINGSNTNYFKLKEYELYGETTFFENLDFETSLTWRDKQSLVPYAFKSFDVDKNYEQLGADIYLRYSPNRHYISMPYGNITTQSGATNFYLLANLNTPAKDEGYESIRLQASAEHEFSWLNKRAHFILRGGTVIGEAPLWETFNQGKRGDGSWFKPWSLGSTNTFETMPYGQFFSEHYIMAQYRQEWFHITKGTPVYTVIRGIYGDFKNKNLHRLYNFDTLDKGYFEGGIEVRRILFNTFGLGAYYNFGAYQKDNFGDNFMLKFTLDVPFTSIKF